MCTFKNKGEAKKKQLKGRNFIIRFGHMRSPSNQATLETPGPLKYPLNIISLVPTRYRVIVSFKGATMHVKDGVWHKTLSLRYVIL